MHKLTIDSHKHPSSVVSPIINGNRPAGRGNDDDGDESHSSKSNSNDNSSKEPLNTGQEKVEAPLELKGEVGSVLCCWAIKFPQI